MTVTDSVDELSTMWYGAGMAVDSRLEAAPYKAGCTARLVPQDHRTGCYIQPW